MFKNLKNAWKVQELRTKILITLALLMVYRAGVYIPVPGINAEALKQFVSKGLIFGFLDLLSGGGFSKFSIFAMGIVPFINSSIIMSLLTIAIPRLEALQKDGEDGRKKIAEYTRYGTVIFALIQAFSISIYLRNNQVLLNQSWLWLILIVITLVAGSTFVMWLGEKMTEFGIGNGSSLIIFSGIVSRIPSAGYQIQVLVKGGTINWIEVILFSAFALLVLVAIVAMDMGERRIPVQYAQRKVGARAFGKQMSHIPINLNSVGIIAIIFAMSVMQFPMVITQFVASPNSAAAQLFQTGWLSSQKPLYPVLYILLIVFFTWFYTSVTFKPDEVAENLQKSGAFIPGIRPGKPTEDYITKVINKMTVIGGLFASFVAVLPIVLGQVGGIGNATYFGGTSLLIVVGVCLEINKQIEAQLVMRHYEGFLK